MYSFNKIKFILLISLSIFLSGCSQNKSNLSDKPVEIIYWQYWTGFEGKAIQKLVNRFNSTHPNIKVKMLTISEPRKKTLLAIIGGDPPDVISSIAAWVPELSNRNALIPLDEYCKRSNLSKEMFMPVFWKMLTLHGHTWALPTTPTATALYWNKDMFIEAGLDPEKPPKTLEELEYYSDKLTKRDKSGKITQVGFLPSWPTWAYGFYALLFNGSWGDPEGNTITANNVRNIEAWKWAQGFIKRLGGKNIQTFQEEFGNYQGPNNPFYTGKIAFEINGVWEGNFIPRFAPKMKWGAAPMPTKSGIPTTVVDCDCILIPKGAKHPKEAFEFITWLMQAENLEELCILQGKFSPLIYSDRYDFIKRHPHPYIKAFIDLAKSENAKFFPQATFYQLYARELKRAFEGVMKLRKSPEEALKEVQKKMQDEVNKATVYEKMRN